MATQNKNKSNIGRKKITIVNTSGFSFVLSAVILILFASTAFADSSPEALINKKAPYFAQRDMNGKKVNLYSFRGKNVLLFFWSSTCPPCQRLIPQIEALHKKYKDQELVIIGMNNKKDTDQEKEFVKDKISSIVILNAEKQFNQYDITGVPTIYYIDRTGKIRYRDVGYGFGQEKKIEKKIEELLAEKNDTENYSLSLEEKAETLNFPLQRKTFEIGSEIYHHKYEEPDIMEQDGTFKGVAFDYTYRRWVPKLLKEPLPNGGRMYRGEARLAVGTVDYDGGLTNGTAYTSNNISDYCFEMRMLIGKDVLLENSLHTLYAGLGYRYLNDNSSLDPYGYERESNYYYVPLGYKFESNLKKGWSWGAGVELDLLLWGMQETHLSKFGLNDVSNRQNYGSGYRASIMFQKKCKGGVFAIEPFVRGWNIADSEISYAGAGIYGIEPHNITTEFGVQLFWRF